MSDFTPFDGIDKWQPFFPRYYLRLMTGIKPSSKTTVARRFAKGKGAWLMPAIGQQNVDISKKFGDSGAKM
jgi:hypothetical protein